MICKININFILVNICSPVNTKNHPRRLGRATCCAGHAGEIEDGNWG